VHVYINAIHALRSGLDPYVAGMAVQRAAHAYFLVHPNEIPPFTYVYSPITLPLLRVVGELPLRVVETLYWAAYIAGSLTIVWVCTQLAEKDGIRQFQLLAPAAPFFAGLLYSNVMLSGNLAYILYGLILAAALAGWKRNHWGWFYLTTVLASCFKAPLLSLLAIPLLSDRKQRLPACLAGIAGVILFAVQPLLWPSVFHNYLEAVNLQFSYNHDFGVSLAGLAGNVLFFSGHPYSLASTLFYLLYAALVLGALIQLSLRFFAGRISLERWIPVMLLGVVLLNPRIKEYDVAPLTLPMALVGWRVISRRTSIARSAVILSLLFLCVNVLAQISGESWKWVEGILLASLFVAGAWDLLQAGAPGPEPSPAEGSTRRALQVPRPA